MIDAVSWLIGIVLAILGIGFGLFYQGRYLCAQENEKENEEKNKKIRRDSANTMKNVGIAWLCIGSVFLVVTLALSMWINYFQ